MTIAERSKIITEWIARIHALDDKAKRARIDLDETPTISVAEVVTWNHRLVTHDDELYQIHAKKLEISK